MKTNDRLAAKYACSERTVRNWKHAGAPLTSPRRMRAWLASRKNIPAGTLAMLAASGNKAKKLSAPADAPKLPVGAPAALVRLAEAEARAFTALEAALADGDPVKTRFAREAWLKIGDSLRRYDLALTESRRDATEQIPRATVEKLLFHIAFCWRQAARTVRDLAPQVVGKDIVEIGRILEIACNESVFSSFAAALSSATLPAWAVSATTKPLTRFPGDDEQLKLRMTAFRKLYEMSLRCALPADATTAAESPS